jgi:hypothetical protein
LPIDQVGGERRQSIILTIGEAVLDCNVLAFDIARLVQAPVKRGDGQCVARLAEQESDRRHRWLLRARRERPCSRAADKGDELAPPHELPSDEAHNLAHHWIHKRACASQRNLPAYVG